MNFIPILGTDATSRPTFVELDDYVPISFRSYEQGLGGVRDVRLGGLSPSFLELTLGLDSKTLRGFTLLCFESIHSPPPVCDLVETVGLPILDIDEARFQGRLATQWLDLPTTFSVGFGEDFLEIDLGLVATADRAIVCGPAKFLVSSTSLVGIRVSGLSPEQLTKVQGMVSTQSRDA